MSVGKEWKNLNKNNKVLDKRKKIGGFETLMSGKRVKKNLFDIDS